MHTYISPAPGVLLQAAALMLGHAHLGADIRVASRSRRGGRGSPADRGEWLSGMIAPGAAGVRGNSDGRLDLLLLDLPAHHVEVCVCVCARALHT